MKSKKLELARKDIKLLLEDKTFILILLIFLFMSLVSSYISWSSQHIVLQVYDEASRLVMQTGNPLPPNPFASVPPLAIMKNMIIYIVLIGALLAIALGHIIAVNDRRAGVTRILFSKPFSKFDFFTGKILATTGTLIIALFLSLIASTISVALIREMSLSLFSNIIAFYILSFVYLAGFAYLGIFFGLHAKNSSMAILLPLLVWIVITFALPEFGSALYPTSSLNPVLPDTTILNSPVLTTFHSIAYPFSISEQFKEAAVSILGLPVTDMNIASFPQGSRILIITIWFFGALGLSYYAVKKFETAQGDIYE
jgi:ABC-type transport system involved in multi-copper enzyme maturation permease subunit